MKATRAVFFNFLKKQGCLKEYISASKKSCIKNNSRFGTNYSLRDYLKNRNVINSNNIFNEDSVNYAFTWSEHPLHNNRNGWSDIHDKWSSLFLR